MKIQKPKPRYIIIKKKTICRVNKSAILPLQFYTDTILSYRPFVSGHQRGNYLGQHWDGYRHCRSYHRGPLLHHERKVYPKKRILHHSMNNCASVNALAK